MSRGLNKVMVIGRVGKDPEMRYTPSGKSVTTFWEESEGTKHCSIEIIANEMMILGERKDINQNSAEMPSPEVIIDGYPFDGEK